MSPSSTQKSKIQDKTIEKKGNKSTSVITVRIDKNLNDYLDEISYKMKVSKANLIRNYLEMAKYVLIERNSLKSLEDRNLILIKKSFLKNIIGNLGELEQINLGEKLGRFINDYARIQGKIDDIGFKLDICEHLGFFPKFIDNDGYILFSNKFGPKKFVEAFTWRLINQEEFNLQFIESEMAKSSKLKNSYEKTIAPIERSSSNYSFEFAKLAKIE